MMKVCLILALTIVASVSAQEAAPEPYSYSYQTDSHGAAEQRDAQGRVTGYYTLTDADGRERRVEYVADEAGFRAKVATNEVGTKAESPADVEVVAAEPTPAQYSQAAQYTQYQSAAAPVQQSAQYTQYQSAAAPVQQSAQFVRQQTYQTAAAPAQVANFARVGYTNQQYAYRPYGASYYSSSAYPYAYGAYGANSASSANSAYGSNYNGAYGGYGAAYYSGGVPSGAYYYSSQQQAAPVGYYSYSTAPATAGQYYSYRSSSSGNGPASAAAFSTAGNTGAAYRFVSQPAGAVTTTYRQVTTGTVPVGVASYSAGVVPSAAEGVGATGSSSSSRSASFQGSSNYLVLKKREAEKKTQQDA